MSFSIPFFRRKSEQSVSRPTKSASSQSFVSRDAQQGQANGGLVSDSLGNEFASKNSSPSKQLKTKTPFIYIESSEAVEAEMDGPLPEKKTSLRSSQLSKTLEQVLHDKDALPYFIQFMDSHAAANLVKFWLDANTFKVTSITRMNSELSSSLPVSAPSAEPETREAAAENENFPPSEKTQNVDLRNAAISPSAISPPVERKTQGQPGSVTAHGHGRLSPSSPTNSPASVPKNACESASLAGAREPASAAQNVSRDIPPSGQIGNSSRPKPCDIVDDREPVRPSAGSLSRSSSASITADGSSEARLEKPCGSNDSSARSGDVCDDELVFQKNLRKSIEKDAGVIFSKYLSPDCSQPIDVSDDLRAQMIGRICHEEGTVDPYCFEDCQQYVFDRMQTQYYSEFLQSVSYIKHQIDILSQLQLVDILYNDTALSYFTEFMEEEKARGLLQCFLDLDNFQHHLLSQGEEDYDGNEAQNDAMIIYDKYISMQATQLVRFDDKVRLRVESDICRENGPLPDCFQLPLQLVLQRMQQVFYPLFVKSEMYTKYVTDLLNTSHLMQDSIGYRRKRSGSDASSEKSAGSQSTGNESVSSKNTYLARDTSGQRFAKAINKFSDNMRIDSSLLNPDNLWHRPNAGRMKFGKVTELGQFVSDFDPDPDHDKKKMAPFFAVSKKRQKEKSDEDMAWQVAQKIIDDVMSTSINDCSPPGGGLPAGNS